MGSACFSSNNIKDPKRKALSSILEITSHIDGADK